VFLTVFGTWWATQITAIKKNDVSGDELIWTCMISIQNEKSIVLQNQIKKIKRRGLGFRRKATDCLSTAAEYFLW